MNSRFFKFSIKSAWLLSMALSASVAFAREPVRVVATPDHGEVPDAEVDGNGTIHVAYVKGENAFYSKSDDDGKSFRSALRINADENTVHPPNMFRGPDLAIGKNRRIHVILYGNGYQRKLPQNEWGVFYSQLDPGQSSFTRPINLNHEPSDNFSLAADSKGHVAVIWMAGNLNLTASSDNGGSFAKSEMIEIADPCECCASRAVFAGGALFIVYREKAMNIRDMTLLSRADGASAFTKQKLSLSPWLINACPMTGTFIAPSGKDLVSAWETKGQVFFGRVLQGSAAQLPKEVLVAKSGKWPIALADANGTVLISWKNGSALHWQLFDPNDRPVGEERSQPSPNTSRHAGVVSSSGFVLID
jgi:hypothetical protein